MLDINERLTRLIQTGQGNFSLERYQASGEPIFWEENIQIDASGKQSCKRLRSAVDQGGEAIGHWLAAAEPEYVQLLAQELLRLNFWQLEDESIEPGEEAIQWKCRLGKAQKSLLVAADGDMLMPLSNLDLIMRRIANSLRDKQQGGMLITELALETQGTERAFLNLAISNPGQSSAYVGNPVLGNGANDFLSIELGQATPSRAGVTDIGVLYQRYPVPTLKQTPAPWEQPYIELQPGTRLIWPEKIPLDLKNFHGFFIRASYSYYSDVPLQHNMQVVRGRAYSNELQLP